MGEVKYKMIVFLNKFLSSFLCVGITSAFLHVSAIFLFRYNSSKMIFRGTVFVSPKICIICIEILPHPCASFGFR